MRGTIAFAPLDREKQNNDGPDGKNIEPPRPATARPLIAARRRALRRRDDGLAKAGRPLTARCRALPNSRRCPVDHSRYARLQSSIVGARRGPFAGALDEKSYGASLTVFDSYLVNGQRTFMETCWLPSLDVRSIEGFIQAMEMAVSPGCAIFTHEFKGAASRVAAEATAFGLRRNHVLVEILAAFADHGDELEEQRHRQWVQATVRAFDAVALPGGYPNLLPRSAADRAAKSYSRNAERLIKAKQHYDPDNVFCSAIPLPVGTAMADV